MEPRASFGMPREELGSSESGAAARKHMIAFERAADAPRMPAPVRPAAVAPHGDNHTSHDVLMFSLLTQVVTARFRLNRRLLEFGLKVEGAKSWLGRMLDVMSLRFSLILWRLAHAILTLVVWQHFFYIKWRQQEANVPDGAPNEGLKRFTEWQ